MRWMVVLLFFANIGYFAWGTHQKSQVDYWLPENNKAQPTASGAQLVLLSEVEAPEQVKPKNSSYASTDASSLQCMSLGPFNSPTELDELQQRMNAARVNIARRTDASVTTEDYWVHIPPLPNKKSATHLLRELQAQKIDSFIITYGELANGISLGLYTKKASAKTVQRRLTSAGYQVEIKILSHFPEKWWLDIETGTDNQLSAAFWNHLANRYPEAKKQKKNCKSIAIAEDFQ